MKRVYKSWEGNAQAAISEKHTPFSVPELPPKSDCQENGVIAMVLPHDCQVIAACPAQSKLPAKGVTRCYAQALFVQMCVSPHHGRTLGSLRYMV